MNLTNRNIWLTAGAIILVLFAIYLFAGQESGEQGAADAAAQPARNAGAVRGIAAAGPEPIRLEWLEPQTGSYESRRNLFAYYERPIPPPPPPPKPVPPPDRDGDGVPDFQDNCPDAANPDQTDVDRNGIGAACQDGVEIAPPPPPPTPPPFPYKYVGTFGTDSNPIAVFSREGELLNVRPGQQFGGKFVLLNIGIESADIGFVGFPPDARKRVPIGR